VTNLRPFRPRWAMLAVCVVFAVATFAVIAFLPRSRMVHAVPDTPDGLNIASVTVLRPEVGQAIDLAGLGWFVVLVALTVRGLSRRAYARAGVAAVAALLGPVARSRLSSVTRHRGRSTSRRGRRTGPLTASPSRASSRARL